MSAAGDEAPSGSTGRGPVARTFGWLAAIAGLLVLLLAGYVVFQYVSLDRGLRRSDALRSRTDPATAVPGLARDTNILLMGLDSRLDMEGNPLPQELYDAMATGNSTIGGMNTNVLMLLHLPSDGSKATVLQIPRDDFVDFPGCPNNRCDGKIKESYDRAFEAELERIKDDRSLSPVDRHTKARDAGRAQQIRTVEAFLGNGIRIDHFVEVTMVAFYELAQVVQPIKVCLKQDTSDSYSKADFKAGQQEINAEQAMAFVRQRRDDNRPELNFTDLDRERRQQAFIASLMHQLRQKGTFANPATLNGLIGVAKKNIAVDADLNLLEFAQQATTLTSGHVTFYTLPVERFGTDKYGGSANFVDLPVLRATVKALLSGTPPEPSPSSSSVALPKVSIVNASGINGAAGTLLTALTATGYGKGTTSTATSLRAASIVEYPSGDPASAQAALTLVDMLGADVTALEGPELPRGSVRITLGSTYKLPAALGGGTGTPTPGGSGTTPGATPTPTVLIPTPVGTAGKEEDTSPTTMTALSGGGIPCVK